MGLPEKRRFAACRSDLGAIRNFIESTCSDFSHADVQRLILVVEELFSNSIEHGYGCDSDAPVWLTLAPTAEGCSIVYADAAPAFDPFAAARDPMLDAETEHRPVGGLGVYLIVKYCSSARYERRDEQNVIKLFLPCTIPGVQAETP